MLLLLLLGVVAAMAQMPPGAAPRTLPCLQALPNATVVCEDTLTLTATPMVNATEQPFPRSEALAQGLEVWFPQRDKRLFLGLPAVPLDIVVGRLPVRVRVGVTLVNLAAAGVPSLASSLALNFTGNILPDAANNVWVRLCLPTLSIYAGLLDNMVGCPVLFTAASGSGGLTTDAPTRAPSSTASPVPAASIRPTMAPTQPDAGILPPSPSPTTVSPPTTSANTSLFTTTTTAPPTTTTTTSATGGPVLTVPRGAEGDERRRQQQQLPARSGIVIQPICALCLAVSEKNGQFSRLLTKCFTAGGVDVASAGSLPASVSIGSLCKEEVVGQLVCGEVPLHLALSRLVSLRTFGDVCEDLRMRPPTPSPTAGPGESGAVLVAGALPQWAWIVVEVLAAGCICGCICMFAMLFCMQRDERRLRLRLLRGGGAFPSSSSSSSSFSPSSSSSSAAGAAAAAAAAASASASGAGRAAARALGVRRRGRSDSSGSAGDGDGDGDGHDDGLEEDSEAVELVELKAGSSSNSNGSSNSKTGSSHPAAPPGRRGYSHRTGSASSADAFGRSASKRRSPLIRSKARPASSFTLNAAEVDAMGFHTPRGSHAASSSRSSSSAAADSAASSSAASSSSSSSSASEPSSSSSSSEEDNHGGSRAQARRGAAFQQTAQRAHESPADLEDDISSVSLSEDSLSSASLTFSRPVDNFRGGSAAAAHGGRPNLAVLFPFSPSQQQPSPRLVSQTSGRRPAALQGSESATATSRASPAPTSAASRGSPAPGSGSSGAGAAAAGAAAPGAAAAATSLSPKARGSSWSLSSSSSGANSSDTESSPRPSPRTAATNPFLLSRNGAEADGSDMDSLEGHGLRAGGSGGSGAVGGRGGGAGAGAGGAGAGGKALSKKSSPPFLLDSGAEGGAAAAAAAAAAAVDSSESGSTSSTLLRRAKRRASKGAAGDHAAAPAFRVPEWAEGFHLSLKSVRLIEKLGQGAFGVVYKGEYQGRLVAVKQILEIESEDPALLRSARAQFLREAQLMRRLPPHRNVLRPIGVCLEPSEPLALITELCEAGSLDVFVRVRRPPYRQVLVMVLDVAEGLRHLHRHNIVHRDLAARNLLMTRERVIKVADFGLARDVVMDGSRTQGAVQGALKWMSPESVECQSFSYKSDVWAFGVTMWELMARSQPFPDLTPAQVCIQIVTQKLRLPLPPGCPARFYDVIMACCTVDVDARPGLDQVLSSLTDLMADENRGDDSGDDSSILWDSVQGLGQSVDVPEVVDIPVGYVESAFVANDVDSSVDLLSSV